MERVRGESRRGSGMRMVMVTVGLLGHQSGHGRFWTRPHGGGRMTEITGTPGDVACLSGLSWTESDGSS